MGVKLGGFEGRMNILALGDNTRSVPLAPYHVCQLCDCTMRVFCALSTRRSRPRVTTQKAAENDGGESLLKKICACRQAHHTHT
jgi:hypothetical protein